MAMFENFPYTNLHELNLDWVLQTVRDLVDEWSTVHAEWDSTKEDWSELRAFVTNYFENLDVQDEINQKIDQMLADGTFQAFIDPIIDAAVADQNARIAVLESRMDTFSSLPDGSTAGDAELRDIRVGYTGRTYATAGDATRGQATDLHYLVNRITGNLASTYYGMGNKYVNGSGVIKKWNHPTTIAVPCQPNTTYIIWKQTVTVMRVGYGTEQDPDLETPVPYVQNVPASNNPLEITTNGAAAYLYIVLWMAGDAAPYDNIEANLPTLLVLPKTDAENLEPEIAEIRKYISAETITPFIDGYDQSNDRNAGLGSVPYTWLDYPISPDSVIRAIKMNVFRAGSLRIGTIKKADVIIGAGYDFSRFVVKDTITIGQTGPQTYLLSNPFSVAEDELPAIGLPDDTLVWKFGSGGDPGFTYLSGGASWTSSVSSLGITLLATGGGLLGETLRDGIKSTYAGKKLSILGDSISSFRDYIPDDQPFYYPRNTVNTVDKTWWYKLMMALQMTLEVNNSWSGSRVTTTNGADPAGCGARADNLGDPDVIIVYMGINDFSGEVQLGSYTGRSAVPTDTTKFREAYGIMLNKILTNYPRAEVWACTLPQCERNAETGFPEVNDAGVPLMAFNDAIKEIAESFGVKVLNHHTAGLTYQNMDVYNPDNLHMNNIGHSLLANNDIRQMDNAVSMRFN